MNVLNAYYVKGAILGTKSTNTYLDWHSLQEAFLVKERNILIMA